MSNGLDGKFQCSFGVQQFWDGRIRHGYGKDNYSAPYIGRTSTYNDIEGFISGIILLIGNVYWYGTLFLPSEIPARDI